MRRSTEKEVVAIGKLLKGKVSKQEAADIIGKSTRTIERYARKLLTEGPEGLKDHRCSNYLKLTIKDEKKIIQA